MKANRTVKWVERNTDTEEEQELRRDLKIQYIMWLCDLGVMYLRVMYLGSVGFMHYSATAIKIQGLYCAWAGGVGEGEGR